MPKSGISVTKDDVAHTVGHPWTKVVRENLFCGLVWFSGGTMVIFCTRELNRLGSTLKVQSDLLQTSMPESGF